MSDKIIAVREIKLTLSFTIPEAFGEIAPEYMPRIDKWINTIIQDFNGRFPSSEMAPLCVSIVAEEVTD